MTTCPQYLWGLCLIPILLALRAYSLSDLPRGQQVASFLLRAGVVCAIVGAMIDLQGLETEPVQTATVFVVDVSESMPDEALERARTRIEEARSVQGRHEVRVVRFAGDSDEVILPAAVDTPMAPIGRMSEDSGRATDLEGALHLAFGLLPHEHLKRVVVVTDGLETRGASGAAIETAERFGVRVHYLDLSDIPRPSELMVTGLQAPEALKPRVPFTAVATVKATEAMSARCEFLVDDVLSATVDKNLEPGDNAVEVSVRIAAFRFYKKLRR